MTCRTRLLRGISLLLIGLLVSCSGPSGNLPVLSNAHSTGNEVVHFPFIISATPLSGIPSLGTSIKLVGNNFGTTAGTIVIVGSGGGQLKVSGADITTWTDSEIDFQLPVKDSSGNPVLSTNPIIGSDNLSVVRADGIANPTNSDLQGVNHSISLQIVSTGLAKIAADRSGHNFSAQSLQYKVVYGTGQQQQTAATATISFNNQLAVGDLSKLFNLPARTDYQVVVILYSGPVVTQQQQSVATGGVILEASPVPFQITPGNTTTLTVPFSCTNYTACDVPANPGASASSTPQPTLAPGQVPTPTPVPTATPTPAPTATPPPGVVPETISSFGTITTIAGTGDASRSTPSSQNFSCTASGIGLPWSLAFDSSNTLFFTMNNGYIAQLAAGSCSEIYNGGQTGGEALEFMQAFTFAGSNDDLYMTDNHNFANSKWRILKATKKSDGTYDFDNATNLSFGTIQLQFPTSVKAYKGKLYIVSSDDDGDGPGQSYVIEYNPSDGTSRIVAGKGSPNYSGDGGAATSAGLSPDDVGFGPVGTAFEDLMVVSDSGNNALRGVNLGSTSINFYGKVIAPGNIETIVGANSSRYSDLVDAPQEYFDNYAYRSFATINGGFSGGFTTSC